jgi:integrase
LRPLSRKSVAVELTRFASMADVRYTLRDKHTLGKTVIILSFNYGEHRLRVSTGISTSVSDWDPERQRFIESRDHPEFQEFNLYLSVLARQVSNKYNEWLVQRRIPLPYEFKRIIQAQFLLKGAREVKSYFWSLFDDFVKEKKAQVKDAVDYDLALRKHLKAAEDFYAQEFTLHAFKQRSGGAIHLLEQYLRNQALNLKGKKGLSVNTIGKQFKNLKVFLKWCFDNGFVQPFALSHIVTYSEEVDTVYLTNEELDQLEQLVLVGEEAIVRDLFLIGCETGLRFSDYAALQSASIHGDNVEVIPKKTRTGRKQQHLVIPISGRFKRILSGYNGFLPSFDEKRLHQFNVTLRKTCQRAGITSLTAVIRQENQEYISRKVEKWELVSSHTARRTFCTLKFLAGMPSESIMKFSGHTSERNFLKYLRLDYQLNADHFRKFF